MPMSKVPFNEKEAVLHDLGDQSHRRAYELQMLRNYLLSNKLQIQFCLQKLILKYNHKSQTK